MQAGVRHFSAGRLGSPVDLLAFESGTGPTFWLANCQANGMRRTTIHAQSDESDDSNCNIHDGTTPALDSAKYDGWARFRELALTLIPFITLLSPATVRAASLEPATSKAWEEYVESANKRMEQHLAPGRPFLWMDEAPDRLASVLAGEIVVSPIGPQNPKKVPSGLIHDWIGAAFIPHVTLQDVMEVARDYARYKEVYQPTVVDSKAIATSQAKDRYSMLLMNKSLFLKTAIDADYESCYFQVDDRRGYSVTRTTRVQEIEEYGSPAQRLLHEGEGSGVIWRLFGITRFVERDGGVYLELEVIGLSRDIPGSLRWLVEPIVRRVSRGSLWTSLRQTQSAVRLHAEVANGKPGSGGSIVATARGGAGGGRDLYAAHSSR
jgi:hypothetical protein